MAAKKKAAGSKPFAGASGTKGRKPQGPVGYGMSTSKRDVVVKDVGRGAKWMFVEPKKSAVQDSTPRTKRSDRQDKSVTDKVIKRVEKSKSAGLSGYKTVRTNYGTPAIGALKQYGKKKK